MKKSNGSFIRDWTTLQRNGRDVHSMEATLTKEMIESAAQEVVSI